MNLSRFYSIDYRRKKYIIISLILVFTFVLFIGILKQKNGLLSVVLGMTEEEPDIAKQLLAKDGLWFVPSFLKKANGKPDTSRMKSKRRICILNVDTRPLERFSDVGNTKKMQFYSYAAYNNLYYAKRHGYDYLRITSPPIPGHETVWTKVAHLYDVIRKYDIVVFFDADAYFVNTNISIEFLLERYHFTVNSSFLMALDPNRPQDKDSKGRVVLNAGFIIAQNNNLTRYVLKKWALCTKTIPGCDKWKARWSNEQRAFNEYIRDEMKIGSELIIAPCNEVNGYDGSGTECHGTILSHVWTAKHTVERRIQKVMLNDLMAILEKEMWKHNHSVVALTSDIEKLAA